MGNDGSAFDWKYWLLIIMLIALVIMTLLLVTGVLPKTRAT